MFQTTLNGGISGSNETTCAVRDAPPPELAGTVWWALVNAEIIQVTGAGGPGAKTLEIERGFLGTPRLQHPDRSEVRQIATGIVAHGSTGEPGEKGDCGPRGYRGADGLPGQRGEKGDTGARGAQGQKGDDGATGMPGRRGERGRRGVPGAPGPERPAVRWQGDYSDATVYQQGDGVRARDGLLYISTVAGNRGNDPAADGDRHWMSLRAVVHKSAPG